ncbi:E3 ubiquitin-protein ligase RNF13-like [Ptychodera flava]|uniref:E3 ubiquitin-protein ligase RNF13-like n=1 Tax=Ptychodera flava TaxID=63121 RepID=UPI003969EDFC
MPPYSTSIPSSVTTLYIFTVVNLLALFHVTCVDADVIVTSAENKTKRYDDMPSNFGYALPPGGMTGLLVEAEPIHGCKEIAPPPKNMTLPFFVIMQRSGCDFDLMVLNAQKGGYRAAIVHNVNSNNIFPMNPNKYGKQVEIPSVFVGENTGLELRERYTYQKGFTVTLTPDFTIPLNYYLLPFAIIVGICFVLMVIFMIAKFIRDRRRLRRSRLSREHLKKLPTQKFKKGDVYDVCAICLDEYEDGEKLRILPCSHAYHCKCVDPWLTGNKRTCPVCKRKVIPGDDIDSSDESDDDDSDPSENTPLLVATMSTMTTARSGAMGTTPASVQTRMSSSYSSTSSETGDSDSYHSSSDSEEPRRHRVSSVASTPSQYSTSSSDSASQAQGSSRQDLIV